MACKHDSHEVKQSEIQKANETHLAGFEKWLKRKGFSQKTINKHVSNVDFYINDYLCYYDLIDASQGYGHIHGFLGNWFIRKAAWASCAQIKSFAASIKKFYTFLLDESVVTHECLDCLCETIKEFMPEWLDNMRRYEDLIFEERRRYEEKVFEEIRRSGFMLFKNR